MAKTSRNGRQTYRDPSTIYNKSREETRIIISDKSSDTWSEKDVRSRVGKFSVWGMKSPSSLGRVFVVFENRPIILGENNRAQASIKKFPVDEAVLPEA